MALRQRLESVVDKLNSDQEEKRAEVNNNSFNLYFEYFETSNFCNIFYLLIFFFFPDRAGPEFAESWRELMRRTEVPVCKLIVKFPV